MTDKLERINGYVSRDEKEEIKKRAKEANLSISAYIAMQCAPDSYARQNPRPSANYGQAGHLDKE